MPALGMLSVVGPGMGAGASRFGLGGPLSQPSGHTRTCGGTAMRSGTGETGGDHRDISRGAQLAGPAQNSFEALERPSWAFAKHCQEGQRFTRRQVCVGAGGQ